MAAIRDYVKKYQQNNPMFLPLPAQEKHFRENNTYAVLLQSESQKSLHSEGNRDATYDTNLSTSRDCQDFDDTDTTISPSPSPRHFPKRELLGRSGGIRSLIIVDAPGSAKQSESTKGFSKVIGLNGESGHVRRKSADLRELTRKKKVMMSHVRALSQDIGKSRRFHVETDDTPVDTSQRVVLTDEDAEKGGWIAVRAKAKKGLTKPNTGESQASDGSVTPTMGTATSKTPLSKGGSVQSKISDGGSPTSARNDSPSVPTLTTLSQMNAALFFASNEGKTYATRSELENHLAPEMKKPSEGEISIHHSGSGTQREDTSRKEDLSQNDSAVTATRKSRWNQPPDSYVAPEVDLEDEDLMAQTLPKPPKRQLGDKVKVVRRRSKQYMVPPKWKSPFLQREYERQVQRLRAQRHPLQATADIDDGIHVVDREYAELQEQEENAFVDRMRTIMAGQDNMKKKSDGKTDPIAAMTKEEIAGKFTSLRKFYDIINDVSTPATYLMLTQSRPHINECGYHVDPRKYRKWVETGNEDGVNATSELKERAKTSHTEHRPATVAFPSVPVGTGVSPPPRPHTSFEWLAEEREYLLNDKWPRSRPTIPNSRGGTASTTITTAFEEYDQDGDGKKELNARFRPPAGRPGARWSKARAKKEIPEITHNRRGPRHRVTRWDIDEKKTVEERESAAFRVGSQRKSIMLSNSPMVR